MKKSRRYCLDCRKDTLWVFKYKNGKNFHSHCKECGGFRCAMSSKRRKRLVGDKSFEKVRERRIDRAKKLGFYGGR